MNAIQLQSRVLDHATHVAEFGLNWFVQSSLLIGLGLGVAWLLRGRGAAVQSAVYRTTLIAVLVCPLLTCVLSLIGVSGLSHQRVHLIRFRNRRFRHRSRAEHCQAHGAGRPRERAIP